MALVFGPVLVGGIIALIYTWNKISIAIVGLSGIWTLLTTFESINNPLDGNSIITGYRVRISAGEAVDPGFGLFLLLIASLLLLAATYRGYEQFSGQKGKQQIKSN
ncbi:hypothetical protein [Halovenus marina]|uniref:hypothetical protein n=1 Tax=Halovenus marina TaxID=3396621 RepID=UPI003F54D7DC